MAVAARLYARSLFEAAKEEGGSTSSSTELGDFVAALEAVPELRSLLTNPELDPTSGRRALDEILGDADELIRNFCACSRRRGDGRDRRDLPRARGARRGRAEAADRGADDGVRALRRRGATILKKIEKSSGRTVEATRKVDSALIGGIMLQVGLVLRSTQASAAALTDYDTNS